jgi:sec-independent protein translocase protein TatC
MLLKTMASLKSSPNSFTILEHLEELRIRLWRALIYVLLGTIASFWFAKDIIIFLKAPSTGIIQNFIFVKPTEIISVYFKTALFAGFTAALPFILYQLIKFIEPAMGEGKKQGLFFWLLSMCLLFFAGTVFSYLVAIPFGIKFLVKIGEGIALPMISLSNYISFALCVLVFGGILFEMPVAACLLAKFGIISSKLMIEKWREAVLGMTIIAAVVTPTTDVFNLTVFLVPMLALYGVSIIAARLAEKKKINVVAELPYET